MNKVTQYINTPPGWDGKLLADLLSREGRIIHICRDDARLDEVEQYVKFFSPKLLVIKIPAWDCLPYDRASPNSEITSQRLFGLGKLLELTKSQQCLVLTTVNAILQRVPPVSFFNGSSIALELGTNYPVEEMLSFLEHNGYLRTGTVREAGEYAVRGGILDIYPTGVNEPLRLDFFGDELEKIRCFDPFTQRTTGDLPRAKLGPVAEILLNKLSIDRFREGYRIHFGARINGDPLYEAIGEGRRYVGMEHWLPLFHEKLAIISDYFDGGILSFDYEVEQIASSRFELIREYYDTRNSLLKSNNKTEGPTIYRPLPPNLLYLTPEDWAGFKKKFNVFKFYPFDIPKTENSSAEVIESGTLPGLDLITARKNSDKNIYTEVLREVDGAHARGKRVLFCAFSPGSAERLGTIFSEHGDQKLVMLGNYSELLALPMQTAGITLLPIEKGFESSQVLFISEPDILGDRLSRPSKRRKRRGEDYLREASSLTNGDFVVHVEHGIGQFQRLETIEIGGAPHDCLCLTYSGGDKLFLPVENIDVLSRYGSEDAGAVLDKLGGVAWQSRKARVKKRLKDMAEQLIKVAADREVKVTEKITAAPGLYESFCAGFKYTETEDQLRSINEALGDLARGRPMDRLICGDVGFGKTEVALRAALVVAAQGLQVAVVVPTTLLCRQHYQVFTERFSGHAIRVSQLSRLVSVKEAAQVKKDVKTGDCNIVIGTHSLLGKSIEFGNLGLLIVDEEQHFGVAQKERLKEIRASIHVLTLTATPIPRTLQLAMSGVRELSLIASPPVDRLSVRTFIMPYDGLVTREAIQRERFRGGQVFYVCPRIEDLARVHDRIIGLIPDIKIATAHGRMGAIELEDIMTAFCDGAFDLLLSTNIIESGLDIPNANTIIIHNSDKFGLAQLYQLRGRVGRSKTRAYAYLTTHPTKILTSAAKRRLEVMQTLDNLGAGFSLASHDMDIRGAGNLLGEEQSGQVKEVGIELYQHLLKEAVLAARNNEVSSVEIDDDWSPQISIGSPVLIPDLFVPDLTVRLSVYRRIAELQSPEEIDSYAVELADRFGKIPAEVNNLFQVIILKILCRATNVEKIEAGPRGALISFRNDSVKNLSGLINLLERDQTFAHIRTDHKLVYSRNWKKPTERISGLTQIMRDLAKFAA